MTTTGAPSTTPTASGGAGPAPTGQAPDVIVLPDAQNGQPGGAAPQPAVARPVPAPVAQQPAPVRPAAPAPAAVPTPRVAAPAPADPRSVRDLVQVAQRDISLLISKEIELAKAELAASVKRGVIGGVGLGAAGLFALFGLFGIIMTAGFGLWDLGLPLWAAFGVVTLVLFGIAGGGVALGGLNFLKIKKQPPVSALNGAKADLAAITGKGKKA